MKYIMGLMLGLATLLLIPSCQSNKRANNYNNKALVDDNGLMFLKDGTEVSLATVKASGLAISNSKNQKVIQFAKSMIDDHTLLTDDFKKLQTDNFVTNQDSINVAHQQLITTLEQKKAADFDRAYMDLLVSQHEEELALFKTAAANKNVNVSEFAQKMMPALQAHLDSAKMIVTMLK
jgi:putative membrane protein